LPVLLCASQRGLDRPEAYLCGRVSQLTGFITINPV